MSDIHHATVPPTFTRLVQQFKDEKSDKHIRFSGKKDLHVHKGKMSGIGKTAAKNRAAKQEEGAKKVKDAIAREFGPEVANIVFAKSLGRDFSKGITVGDILKLKAEIESSIGDLPQVKQRQDQVRIFDFVTDQTQNLTNVDAFLRGNPKGTTEVTQMLTQSVGTHFSGIRNEVKDAIRNGGPALMREDDLAKVQGGDEKTKKAMVQQSLQNLELALNSLFGGTSDTDIKAAAAKIPQEYCDLLAAALSAVENSSFSDGDKAKMKDVVLTNFGGLRLINPLFLQPDDDKTLQKSMTDVAKQIQNVCNGVDFGREPLARQDEFNAIRAQWTPVYQKFMQEIVARGRSQI